MTTTPARIEYHNISSQSERDGMMEEYQKGARLMENDEWFVVVDGPFISSDTSFYFYVVAEDQA